MKAFINLSLVLSDQDHQFSHILNFGLLRGPFRFRTFFRLTDFRFHVSEGFHILFGYLDHGLSTFEHLIEDRQSFNE